MNQYYLLRLKLDVDNLIAYKGILISNMRKNLKTINTVTELKEKFKVFKIETIKIDTMIEKKKTELHKVIADSVNET